LPVQLGKISLKKIAAMLAAALVAGCQSSASTGQANLVSTQGYPVEFPQLTCQAYGKPNGGGAKLTASRVTPGAPAYIEFRQRAELQIPTGHMYVVFGRLDAAGNPRTRQYIGLFPKGGVIGLYGGAVVPIEADLTPRRADCGFSASAAYRVSLTEGQYQALLRKVGGALANPPKWHMFANNCNHFATSLGSVAGLRGPANRTQPSFSYIHAYIAANGDGRAKPAKLGT
jgi:hypothetical protein